MARDIKRYELKDGYLYIELGGDPEYGRELAGGVYGYFSNDNTLVGIKIVNLVYQEMKDLKKKVEELGKQNTDLVDKLCDGFSLLPGCHQSTAKCPTYFDGCHCTNYVLEDNIKRANRAEAKVEELTKALMPFAAFSHKWREIPCLYADRDRYPSNTMVNVFREGTPEQVCITLEDYERAAKLLGMKP